MKMHLKKLAYFIHGHMAKDYDLEIYTKINEEYKPSDWTGNEKTNEIFSTFAQDGMGSQIAIWHREKNHEPVVYLGSEGELAIFADNYLDFLMQIANGLDPIVHGSGDPFTKEFLHVTAEMVQWLKETCPSHKFLDPLQAYQKAQSHLKELDRVLVAHSQKT